MSARLAEFSDIEECLRMGRAFSEAAGLTSDDDSMQSTLIGLVENRCLFVAGEPVHAMAGALLYQNYFNLGQKVAQELFWWVDPEARRSGAGRALLDTMESWARDNEARTLTMVSLDALDGEKVGQMYQAHGYKPLERNFCKVL